MKLLVTTDFSANSKGAIRFAAMLAQQADKVEVIFYHVIQIMKPTSWNESFYHTYRTEEVERLKNELKKFVKRTARENINKFSNIDFVVQDGISTARDIIEFADKNKVDFICMATQGAGLLRKIMGTTASFIVNNTKTPVLVIPNNYRAKPLKNITYLSDFENIKQEINTISRFLSPITHQLEVLHYARITLDKTESDRIKAMFETKKFKNIKLNIKESNLELPLVERVTTYVSASKPDLLIMFTKKEKSFFEKLFIPSKSAELTYSTKVPVLIYNK